MSVPVIAWFAHAGDSGELTVEQIPGAAASKTVRLELISVTTGNRASIDIDKLDLTPEAAVARYRKDAEENITHLEALLATARENRRQCVQWSNDYRLEQRASSGVVWCDGCGCNVARSCCCAKDCQEHPSGRSLEVTT